MPENIDRPVNLIGLVLAVAFVAIASGAALFLKANRLVSDDTNPVSNHEAAFYNVYAEIPEEKIQRAAFEAEWVPIDSIERYNEADIVAIIRVDSIDRGSCYDQISESQRIPYTYGRATVIKAYKGRFGPNEQIDYASHGGISRTEECSEWYFRYEPRASKTAKESLPEYIDYSMLGSVQPEPGKFYFIMADEARRENGELAYYQIGAVPPDFHLVDIEAGLEPAQVLVLYSWLNEGVPLSTAIPFP